MQFTQFFTLTISLCQQQACESAYFWSSDYKVTITFKLQTIRHTYVHHPLVAVEYSSPGHTAMPLPATG